MNTSILTDSSSILSQSSPKLVFEYSLSVIDCSCGDVQNLTAAFNFSPSDRDWSNWLSGWSSCGYSLLSNPILKRIL